MAFFGQCLCAHFSSSVTFDIFDKNARDLDRNLRTHEAVFERDRF